MAACDWLVRVYRARTAEVVWEHLVDLPGQGEETVVRALALGDERLFAAGDLDRLDPAFNSDLLLRASETE